MTLKKFSTNLFKFDSTKNKDVKQTIVQKTA